MRKANGNNQHRRHHQRTHSQSVSTAKIAISVDKIDADIFKSQPRAKAPLDYSTPVDSIPLVADLYAYNGPMATFPSRPPTAIARPLAATYLETEQTRPHDQPEAPGRCSSSELPLDPAAATSRDSAHDPTVLLVKRATAIRASIRLLDEEITDETLPRVSASAVLVGSNGGANVPLGDEPMDVKSTPVVKRRKKDFRLRMENDEEGDVNDNIVAPENLLRMIDSELVDTPPTSGKKRQPYEDLYSSSNFLASSTNIMAYSPLNKMYTPNGKFHSRSISMDIVQSAVRPPAYDRNNLVTPFKANRHQHASQSVDVSPVFTRGRVEHGMSFLPRAPRTPGLASRSRF